MKKIILVNLLLLLSILLYSKDIDFNKDLNHYIESLKTKKITNNDFFQRYFLAMIYI